MRRALLAAAVLAAALALPAQAAAARPPVMMLVFDEFPSISLLDSHGRIDSRRYPNFAALAAGGTWFPNGTASVDETGRATETLLTGNTPERKRPRNLASNPHSLFTWLGRSYRMNISEEATALCPRRFCPHAHVQSRSELKRELGGGRPERFRRWLRSVKGSRRPTLYFKHVLLPHVPLRYFPSGRVYTRSISEPIPGIVENFHNHWLVDQAYQRHLLQLEFTDRLLGEFVQRLRATGLYDRSLIVVTADNGESFGLFGNRHQITDRKAANIAFTPLFLKLPHQRRGRTLRRHGRTVDVVPTIAHVLHRRLTWRTQGKSMLGPAARRIPSTVDLIQRSGRRFTLSLAALKRQARARLRAKLALFGSGDERGVFAIGPHPELLGHPLFAWHTTRARRTSATLNGRKALRTVRRDSGLVPSLVTGRITRGARRRPRPLAFSVNGWLVATAPTFHMPGDRSEYFCALIPEAFIHDGSNEVQVLAVQSTRVGINLARVF